MSRTRFARSGESFTTNASSRSMFKFIDSGRLFASNAADAASEFAKKSIVSRIP